VQPDLTGMTVMLTRSKEGNHVWGRELTAYGADIYDLPTINTAPATVTDAITVALQQLSSYDWLIFTSTAGVRYFGELINSLKKSPVVLPSIAAVGQRTAQAVKMLGHEAAFVPTQADSATLTSELPNPGRALLLRADIADPSTVRELEARGFDVTDLPIYTTHLLSTPDPKATTQLVSGDIDTVVFASPSAVRGFIGRVNEQALAKAQQIPAIALGQSTAAALQHTGFQRVHITAEANLKSVAQALAASREQ